MLATFPAIEQRTKRLQLPAKAKGLRRHVTKDANPRPSSIAAQHRMQATRRRDTPGEIALRTALRALGLRYRVDVTLPGTRRRADVAFLKKKVAVFVDGCFWHGCPEHGTWPKANANWWQTKIKTNQRRDKDTELRLQAAGWTVLRFWEHADAAVAARCVAKALKEQSDVARHSKHRR
jgi:DNA mismatch endonuclease (patch repair protein)